MSGIEGHLARIEAKLDRQDERLDRIEVLQARHTASLEDHMRRTEAAESQLLLVEDTLKPLKLHVAVTGALAKVLGVAGTCVAIAKALGLLNLG
jgi:chromosome segregation ATPase